MENNEEHLRHTLENIQAQVRLQERGPFAESWLKDWILASCKYGLTEKVTKRTERANS